MQSLYPNVPNYGEVPRGASDAQMLASLEGRQMQAQPQPVASMPLIGQPVPVQQQQTAPTIGKVSQNLQTYEPSGTVSTTQPLPTAGQPQQNIPAQKQPQQQQQQQASAGEVATNAATTAATTAAANYAAGQATGTAAAGTGAGMGAAATAAAPYAGAALAAYAAYRGLDDSREAWEEGNRTKDVNKEFWLERTDGGGAAIHSGTADIFGGEIIPQEWIREIGWRANPVTAPLAFAEDVFGVNTFTGKDDDQVGRDRVRTGLNRAGILNDNYEFELANGQLYYAGNDGNTPQYQIQNTDNPLTGRVVGAAQVMAGLMLGEPGKSAEDLTGQLANMALSNATTYEQAMGNLMFQFEKFVQASGLTPQAARDEINSWVKEGLIDQQAADAYLVAHESFLEGNPWQFTNEQAAAPLEDGQPQQAAPTFMFDPASNIRPSDGTPFPTITPAQPQQSAQPPATPPTTQGQAPKVLETPAGTMNSIPIGGKPGIVTQPTVVPNFGRNFPYIRNIQAMLNRGR